MHKGISVPRIYVACLTMSCCIVGFLDSYNEVQKDLVKEVEAQVAQYPDYKLTVTG